MNAERLMAHFERISEASDAIARLRRFILDLAVRGKLVEQDPKNVKPQGFMKQDQTRTPFDLPSNWIWVQIGDQLNLINGMPFKSTDWMGTGLRIVRIQNLNNSNAPFNYCDPGIARERSLIDNGSFLISWSGTPGTSFGAFIWERGPAVLNQHIFRCDFKTQSFNSIFLRLAINGRLDEMISKAHGGVGLQHITKGKLEALPIPLPPLAEQHRIVAKVDELMAICDQLEAARQQREHGRERLMAATLQRLNQPAADPASYRNDASFALRVLPSLTTTPAQIKQLRQTILNLAVRGKLVEQDPDDEPAEELLSKISQDLMALTLQRRSRSQARSVLTAEEDPFSLPCGWQWVSLDELFRIITDGDHQPPPKASEGVSFLTIGNISGGTIDFNGCRFVPKEYFDSLDEIRRPGFGDILYTVVGASYGRPVIVATERPFCVQRHIAILKPSRLMNSGYLLQLLSSPFVYSQATACLTGTAQPTIPLRPLRNFLAPLPPLSEQHRIVAKVDELMALCDQLEQQLNQADQQRRRLLEALLAEALGGRLPTEEESHATVA